MEISHAEGSPFRKPRPGKKYGSLEHGSVSITEYRANRFQEYRDYPDSAFFAISVGSVGMGGESLVRKRVIPWEEYSKLKNALKEAAISSTECVVEPPSKWTLAVKSGLAGYLKPREHDAGTLMFHYPDELWDIDSYHPIVEDASIVADIPDENLDDLHNKVSFEEPKSGHIYLNSNGDACIYSRVQFGSSLSCTRFKICNINPIIVDTNDTYILPISEQSKLNTDKMIDLEWNYENVWVQGFGGQCFDRKVQIIFDNIVNPDSLTARLGTKQEWMNFGLEREKESIISRIGSDNLNSEEVAEKLGDIELEKRREISKKVNDYQNKFIDSIREFTRSKNL